MSTTKRLGNDHAWCVLSSCEKYRYELGREWAPSLKRAVFVMLNPSTATHDPKDDDLTLKKCVGFAKKWNLGGVVLVNAFAYRSTNPRALLSVHGPIGSENDIFVLGALLHPRTCLHVAAWGGMPQPHVLFAGRFAHIEKLSSMWHCLGVTSTGAPRHPSRLGYDTPLRLLETARSA